MSSVDAGRLAVTAPLHGLQAVCSISISYAMLACT